MDQFAFSNAEELSAKYSVMAKTTPAKLNKFARDTGDFIVDVARTAAPKRTGRLSRSIGRSGVHRTGDIASVRINWGPTAARYGRFVEYGTGFYDPEGSHYIFPKSAKAMRWVEKGPFATQYKGAGIISRQLTGQRGGKESFAIFARFTRGQPGQHFMQHAFESADKIYVPARLAELGQEIIH